VNAVSFEPGAFAMAVCTVCGAPFLRVMGVRGSRVWYRCNGCGADVAGANVDATRAAVARAADVSEMIDGAEQKRGNHGG